MANLYEWTLNIHGNITSNASLICYNNGGLEATQNIMYWPPYVIGMVTDTTMHSSHADSTIITLSRDSTSQSRPHLTAMILAVLERVWEADNFFYLEVRVS